MVRSEAGFPFSGCSCIKPVASGASFQIASSRIPSTLIGESVFIPDTSLDFHCPKRNEDKKTAHNKKATNFFTFFPTYSLPMYHTFESKCNQCVAPVVPRCKTTPPLCGKKILLFLRVASCAMTTDSAVADFSSIFDRSPAKNSVWPRDD